MDKKIIKGIPYSGEREARIDAITGQSFVQEAGGRVSNLAGGPFNLQADEIFVSNGLIHEEMIPVFSEVLGQKVRR